MYRLVLKYKRVIINALILIALILISVDFHKSFFLGVASGAVLINLGESIGNLKRNKDEEESDEEKMLIING
ncbi:MAG: hypothetical protein ABI237_13640 [Ginsengibacter sp.]